MDVTSNRRLWRIAELILWLGVAAILYRHADRFAREYRLEYALSPLLVVSAVTLSMRLLPLEAIWTAFDVSRSCGKEDRLEAWFGKFAWTVISSNLFYAVLMGFIVWFTANLPENKYSDWAPGVQILFGVSGGWVAGILLSPIGQSESATFLRSTQAVATFLGGYAASNFSERIRGIADNADAVIMTELVVAAAMATTLIVYINRYYFRPDRYAKNQQDVIVNGGN